MIQKKSQKMCPEKAEILGLLCAEGSHYIYTTTWDCFFKNRGKNGKYYTLTRTIEAIEFTNLNEGMLQHFRKLMLYVYNYAPRPTGIKTSMKIRIRKKSVIRDLLRYTDFGCMKWSVPNEIFKGNNKILAPFIRGLFDGDGTFQRYAIILTSINLKGVKKVSKALKLLGIKSRIMGPYQGRGNVRPIYHLLINKEYISKYKDLIGSNHPVKVKC